MAPTSKVSEPPTGSAVDGPTRRAVPFCLAVFLVVRVLLSVLGVLVVEDAEPLRAAGFPDAGIDRPVESGWHNAFQGTYRWDGGWFVRIASQGYDADDGSAEFYPAFPLAARVAADLSPLGPVGASILVANLCFLAGLIVLFLLTALEYTESVARRTVVLVAAFPASFIFMSPFSESLFLLATVGAFYLARRGRWLATSAAGVVATATRAAGVLIIPSLMIEAWTTGDLETRWRRLVASGAAGIGFAAYLGYWAIRGDATIPLRAPELWGRTMQVPITMLGRSATLGIAGVTDPEGVYWTMDLILTAFVLVPLIVGYRLVRPSYLLYGALTFLTVLTVTYAPRPLVGTPRYAAVVFPAFWVLALKLGRRGFALVVAAFVVGYLWVATMFMQQRHFVF